MSCDNDRENWWKIWNKWFENHFPEEFRKLLIEMLDNYIQSKMDEAARGGNGRVRSPKRKSNAGYTPSSTNPPSHKPTPVPISPKRKKHNNPPAEIYNSVKSEALKREFDYTAEERDELAWKTRMLRRWIRITSNLSLDIDPAHGSKTDLPRISSQVAYAAVYDWMVIAEFKDLISPFDTAYKAIWQEKNSYKEQVNIDMHKQVEEIDIKVHRGELPLPHGDQQVKIIIDQLSTGNG